jgi:hypothetical protein
VTFADEENSRVYFLKQDNEVLEYFEIYKNKFESFHNKKTEFLQTDKGRLNIVMKPLIGFCKTKAYPPTVSLG